MRKLLWTVSLVAAATGCESLNDNRAELTWQAIHAADVVQTVDIARGGHCQEAGFGTHQLIGANPGTAGAIGWGIASAGVHLAVTHWLMSIDAPRWVSWLWQSMTIGIAGQAVTNNADLSC